MRISNVSVSGRNIKSGVQHSVFRKQPLLGSGLKAALTGAASVILLSGCLLDGDLSGSDARSELLSSLGENSSRGTGESGGTGSSVTAPPSTGALTNPGAMSDHYPGTHNYSKQVDLPSCDAPDALRISTAAGLSQINNSSYRVFCIAPGDYRSHGLLALSGSGGTESAPKVIRLESSEFSDTDEIFTADISKIARMPAIDIRNTSHWVLNRLAFIETSGMPIRMAGANGIIIDRIRFENNLRGIEFQHGTNDSYVQNSYIGNQVIRQGVGNDGVCVAMIGHYRQENLGGSIDYDYPVVAKNNFVVNNEIYNCNDGFQIVWQQAYANYPDFQGTVIAGNDIYSDSTRRTNCFGSLSSNGDCGYTENALDFKAASLNPSNPAQVFDNRMWGWRRTDSVYNPPANSWGTAISAHFKPVQNLHIYENVIWDVGAAISFTRGPQDSIISDNIITDVTGAGSNHGIGLTVYSDAQDYNHPTYSSYGNVSEMTVERNHVITSGGAWLSTSAEDSYFGCNVVKDGTWTATSGSYNVGLTTDRNTYYGTNSGALSGGSDLVRGSGESNMGQLCFRVKQASVPGGEEVCLDHVLDTASSPNLCASEYWTADNWQ